MATTWSSFYPYVQPYVPGCPEVVIESHLQEAANKFCEKSEVWRFVIEPDFTSKNTSDYAIDIPTNTVLESILYLHVNGLVLKPSSERFYLDQYQEDGTDVTGRPITYTMYDNASIKLHPTPDGKYTFNGLAILKPSLSATGVEDFIFESYGRAIASGAISQLAAIPNKEWTNPDLAMMHEVRFNKEIAAAKGRDTRRVNLRVTAVKFADQEGQWQKYLNMFKVIQGHNLS